MKLDIEAIARQAGMDEASARANALSPKVLAFTKAVVERCAKECDDLDDPQEMGVCRGDHAKAIRNLLED